MIFGLFIVSDSPMGLSIRWSHSFLRKFPEPDLGSRVLQKLQLPFSLQVLSFLFTLPVDEVVKPLQSSSHWIIRTWLTTTHLPSGPPLFWEGPGFVTTAYSGITKRYQCPR
ncbi:hypothetical protein AVEN_175330-1 [Araneus ventricosus]|uniref:Uncharacterized protein n=1 Tax=Araneus ventricosus TaxID=182803 RepID=A0A4Y2H0Q2_ARAVE|nr:hypothetical protein AVEN_175330-1 [Araneus ventricosus]